MTDTVRIHKLLASTAQFFAFLAISICLFATNAWSQPNLSGLVSALQSIPDGGWVKVNQNSFQDAWVPADRRSLYNGTAPSPGSIILAWSSLAWDSKRGDLLLYGGGHANYSGNEMYRWRGRTQRWELASLPSDVVYGDEPALYFSVDGPLNAPASAHTYDNNVYLSIADRFLTLGGASFNTGEGFVRRLPDGSLRATGPYTFDLDRVNPTLVGGTTNSHVNTTGAYPTVLGGFMWDNRDAYRPEIFGSSIAPTNFVSGYTAVTQENGRDVLYVGGKSRWATDNQLFRYTIVDPNNALLDRWEQVGRFWGGSTGAGSAALHPTRQLFVFTGAANSIHPFGFWDLTRASAENDNVNFIPFDLSGEFDFSRMYGAGLDFHPQSGTFKVWTGGRNVYSLTPPQTNSATGWTLTKQTGASLAAPPSDLFNEVWGKFKLIPELNAFVALEGAAEGNVWLYRPHGWTAPTLATANADPTVSVTRPVNATQVSQSQSLLLSANANDPDGSIAFVEFMVDGEVVATRASAPYDATVANLPLGLRAITARAVDNRGNAAVAQPVGVTVVNTVTNSPPTIQLTAPLSNLTVVQGSAVVMSAQAGDIDGSVARVEFLINNVVVSTINGTGPYSLTLSSLAVGSHQLSVRATDNAGAQSTSGSVVVTVNAPPPPNVPPQVQITSPNTNLSVAVGTNVSFQAQAGDSDGSVVRVELLVDGLVVQSITGSGPYATNLTNLAIGTHQLLARATDNAGAQTTTGAVQVTVTSAVGTNYALLQNGQGGYTGVEDVTLNPMQPQANQAADATLSTERAVVSGPSFVNLLKFKIFASEGGPVPNGATIESAKLSLYKSTNAYDGLFTATRLARSWDNATASWVNAAAAMPWTVPGAAGVDSDVSAVSDGAGVIGWSSGWLEIDVTSGVGQLSAGASNFGWRLVMTTGNESLKQFHSSESASAALRPKLEISYRAAVTTPTNVPPQIELTQPSPGLSVVQGTTVNLSAQASDSDGSIARVEFLINGTTTSTINGAGPYSYATASLTAGSYSLSARATDNMGAQTTSATVQITVTSPPANVAPTISLVSPTNDASVTLGTAVLFDARASDADGAVAKVEFFINGVLYNVVNGNGPHRYSNAELAVGTYQLTAAAIDNLGARTVSAPVTLTVTRAANTSVTVSLQDGVAGYARTTDTSLSSANRNRNYGTNGALNLSPNHVKLIRFAVFASEGGPVPNGATITSATLSIYKSTNAYDGIYTARPLLKAWTETEATWNRPSATGTWTSPGGATLNGDVTSLNASTASLGWNAGWINFDVRSALVAMTQGAANHGWHVSLTQGSQETLVINGRESGTTSLRPKLTITYAPAP